MLDYNIYIKNLFPIFRHNPELCFLDNAATTHKPQQVIDAISNCYSHDYASVGRGSYLASYKAQQAYDLARQTTQNFIHATSAKEIIFTWGCTYGINLFARIISHIFSSGDEIIISQFEHNANLLPWIILADRLCLKIIYCSLQDALNSKINKYLTNKTKLICLNHISNSTGACLPIENIIKQVKSFNESILTLVDGAQSIACIPVNVTQLGCDAFVVSGHKCYGPNGTGFLYLKESMHDLIQWGDVGGGHQTHYYQSIDLIKQIPRIMPNMLEFGTLNLPNILGLQEALKFISQHSHNMQYQYSVLHQQAITGITLLGFNYINLSPCCNSILSFYHDRLSSYDISSWLSQHNVCVRADKFCNHLLFSNDIGIPNNLIRISFGLYNDQNDITCLINNLTDAISILQ